MGMELFTKLFGHLLAFVYHCPVTGRYPEELPLRSQSRPKRARVIRS